MLTATRKAAGWTAVMSGVLLLVLAAGCAKQPVQSGMMAQIGGIEISAEELRILVRDLADAYAGVIEEAADEIIAATDDRDVRRRAYIWKIQAIPVAFQAIFLTDPMVALLDTYAFTYQMRIFFQEGPGRGVFGEQQEIALEACDRLEAMVVKVGNRASGRDTRGDVVEQLEAWAREHPIDGHSFSRETLNSYLADVQSIQRVGGFKAIGKLTVDMSDLNARLTTIASHLPKQAHWQALLILEEYLDSEEADVMVEGLAEFPGSLERVALALEGLDDLVARERALALEAVRVERLEVQKFVDETLTRTLEYLTMERLAILEAAHGERVAVLEAIRQERLDTLQILQQERELILAEMNGMADRLVGQSGTIVDRAIDHFFLRLVQILAVLLAVAVVVTLVALRFMTRRSATA
jgi:hypothetical protein